MTTPDSELRRLHAENAEQADRIASLEAEKSQLEEEMRSQNNLSGIVAERVKALEAQLSQAQAVPDGWRLVPNDPPDEVRRAAQRACMDHSPHKEWLQDDYPDLLRVWRAMLAASPTPPARKECWCTTCRPITLSDMRFVVCPDCGNKRCPKAHHDNACTNSNAPGQPGSRWEHVKPQSIQGEGK